MAREHVVAGTLNITGDADGNVVLSLGDGVKDLSVSLSAKEAGEVVYAILKVAAAVQPTGGPKPGAPMEWTPIEPTLVSVGSTPVPNSEAIVFGFGPARLGVSLSRPRLKQLGEALLALSASGAAQ